MRYPWNLCLVEWKDHVSDSGGWVDSMAAVTRKPAMCLTVGWLIFEDEEGIALVSCIDPVTPEVGQVGGTQYILKNCITKTTILRKGKNEAHAVR